MLLADEVKLISFRLDFSAAASHGKRKLHTVNIDFILVEEIRICIAFLHSTRESSFVGLNTVWVKIRMCFK